MRTAMLAVRGFRGQVGGLFAQIQFQITEALSNRPDWCWNVRVLFWNFVHQILFLDSLSFFRSRWFIDFHNPSLTSTLERENKSKWHSFPLFFQVCSNKMNK